MKWLLLVRGIKAIINETSGLVRSGPMAPMISVPWKEKYESNTGKVDEHVTAYFNRLCAAFVECSEPRVSEVCISAVKLLQKSFAGMAYERNSSLAFFWPTQVPPDFILLLESKRPEALVVLASYCVLLHTQNWRWWVSGAPANMLRAINGMLNEQWRGWLSWPFRAIRDGDGEQSNDCVLAKTEGNSKADV